MGVKVINYFAFQYPELVVPNCVLPRFCVSVCVRMSMHVKVRTVDNLFN